MFETQSVANCTKCGVRHLRPVGVRCYRNLNSSAPVVDLDHSSLPMEFQNLPGPSHSGTSTPTQTRAANTSAASEAEKNSQIQVDSKLDLILKMMEQIEAKNAELELKIQQPIVNSAASLRTAHPRGHISVHP